VRSFPCDAVYAGGGKWLLALQGIAFLYLRSDLLDSIKLRLPSWRSVADMWNFLDYEQPPVADVSRFEGGTPNYLGALSLATSIEFLRAHDVSAIADHVLSLTDRLVEGLERAGARVSSIRDGARRSGIVTFNLEGHDPSALGRRLGENGFCVTYYPFGIRVSPHGYNTPAEIDAFVETVSDVSALARRR